MIFLFKNSNSFIPIGVGCVYFGMYRGVLLLRLKIRPIHLVGMRWMLFFVFSSTYDFDVPFEIVPIN